MLVDLVGEQQRIELLAERADLLELAPREHLPRRIVRSVHDDGLGPLRKCGAELARIVVPIRRVQLHVHGRGAGQDRVRAVIFVPRLEYDHFFSRIHGRQ